MDETDDSGMKKCAPDEIREASAVAVRQAIYEMIGERREELITRSREILIEQGYSSDELETVT